MNIKAIALGAVITLSACGGAQAASITTPVASTTTKETNTTVAPTATIVMPTSVAPTTTVVALGVTSVVDGDTIDLSDGTVIRLIGIDTPESDQCGYEDAAAIMAGLVTGFDITLMPGARDDVDKYGRLLRYVEANGIDVNLAMIESGRAIARYDGRDGYGEHPRQASYVAADEATPTLNQCVVPLAAPVPSTPATNTPTITTPATAAVAMTTPPPTDVYYKNCAAVRAAGAAPIHAGDPGWRTKFDADGDGVGCE